MERYNYLEAVTADAKEYLLEHYETEFILNSEDYSILYDDMINTDSVTGNASGSYTFNRWQAEENLCHNNDLLLRAAEEQAYIVYFPREWVENPEIADVIIRCYLLENAIRNAMEEIRNEHN